MVAHSSILAWRIPWTEEIGWQLQRVMTGRLSLLILFPTLRGGLLGGSEVKSLSRV